MRKNRVATTIIVLLLTLCCLGIAIYAILQKEGYISNNVWYHFDGTACPISIDAQYVGGPELSVNGQKTYTKLITFDDILNNNIGFETWRIGDVYLTTEDYYFELQLTIRNLHQEKNLIVSISEVAVDNNFKKDDVYVHRFQTTAKKLTIGGSSTNLIITDSSTNPNTGKVEDVVIPKYDQNNQQDTVTITLRYELKVFNQEINSFKNNVNVSFKVQD